MLKALELYGFKSFADRTRFEFPAGITVVVGPNGSGKSNIVDGIKWVLGEQSPKSLRGKDMADVIFKGGGGGRKPMNTAEATLVFDNSEGRLPVDAPEVHVTRRVYRSGEGEYLINKQPCRLKDIRDLFRGTGVGVDAYSLIEQGKVDRMLQASPKDRRAIFEEAAGISRFKAKKVEAQRRLERVEQNMLRLTDIVEEVENRLKSVRNQASKARRYREYTQRLQQLRTQVGLTDWRKLSAKLAELEGELDTLRAESGTLAALAEAGEAHLLEVDAQSVVCGESIRNQETRLARQREMIAQLEMLVEHERERCRELEESARRHRADLAVLSDRAGDSQHRLEETRTQLTAAETNYRAHEAQLAAHEAQVAALTQSLDKLRQAGEATRAEYVAAMQEGALFANQAATAATQLAAAQAAREQLTPQLAALTQELERAGREAAAALEAEQQTAAAIATHLERIDELHKELEETKRLVNSRQEDVAQLQQRKRGLNERAAVIEELERTREGLGAGVKQVLALTRNAGGAESLAVVRGVVADLLQVSFEHAPLVDIALGDMAQHVVIAAPLADLPAIADSLTLPGRVAFVSVEAHEEDNSLPSPPSSAATRHPSLAAFSRLSDLIESAPEFLPLVERLLGQTYIVRDLASAVRLLPQAPAGTRFVTRAGELLDSHGAISVGPRQTGANLVSRRTELRTLKADLLVVAQQIVDSQHELDRSKAKAAEQERKLTAEVQAVHRLEQTQAQERLTIKMHEEKREQALVRREAASAELAAAERKLSELNGQLADLRMRATQEQERSDGLAAEIRRDEQRQTEVDRERQSAAKAATAVHVELARSEQQLESLRLRMTQFEDDQRERRRAVEQVREQLAQALDRFLAGERTILSAESQLAELYLGKEAAANEIRAQRQERDELGLRRKQAAEEVQAQRRQASLLQERLHQQDLAANQVRLERTALESRLRDDYGIELSALTHEATPEEEAQRHTVEEEIESLRRKINQIGAVNLDALDELDSLEERFQTLAGQHRDLTEAKETLVRIIQKINNDSKRLFLETLEAIRVNFQQLYRRAFGGGKADIVLEENADVLECGIDILCTPPGKPSFSNSLLSGGEKALTAVALLLAIFQFRPSPFCVLDEVDAPFDEANIGRFVDVLKEFLGWTKFIIVTHSKKTMTAATTLYGVTMQESGVSKRVSVKFDDVTDDGHIKREAVDREAEQERGVA
jgi:chromosome segregation protein